MGNSNDRRGSGNSNSSERSGEVSRLKASARGTIEELQQFLGEMRGKSPQEVMGLVAASGLTQGILWSTLGTVIVLLIFTVLPYFLYDAVPDKTAAANKKKAAAAATAEKTAAEAADKAAADKAGNKGGEGDKQAAIKSMTKELDETKGATAEDAPDLDNLLEKELEDEKKK